MKISKTAVFVLALGTVALIAADAYAQGRRGGRGGMGRMGAASLLRMIDNEKVQQELKLEEEQIQQIQEFAEEHQDALGAKFQELRESGEEEDMRAAMEGIQSEMAEAEMEKMAEILDESQLKRYRELRIQLMGVSALTNDKIAEEIGLTEEDIQAVRDAIATARENMMEKFQELRESGDQEAMREAFSNMQNEVEEAVMAVLSDEQKEKFKELKGEEFEFPERRRRGQQREDF